MMKGEHSCELVSTNLPMQHIDIDSDHNWNNRSISFESCFEYPYRFNIGTFSDFRQKCFVKFHEEKNKVYQDKVSVGKLQFYEGEGDELEPFIIATFNFESEYFGHIWDVISKKPCLKIYIKFIVNGLESDPDEDEYYWLKNIKGRYSAIEVDRFFVTVAKREKKQKKKPK